MKQVWDFFAKLFDVSDWPPRWHCGKWSDFHGWLYIVSDLLIWSAYFAIPFIIIRFISKRKDVHFHRIYFLFAAFILACGSTHLLDAIMFWFPAYRLSALIRFITGAISWVTVFALFKALPAAFSLKSPQQLEEEIEQRKKAEEQLNIKNALLNEAQSIAKIGHWQWDTRLNKLTWSESLYKAYEIAYYPGVELTFTDFINTVYFEDRQYVSDCITKAMNEKKFSDFFHRIKLPDGRIKTIHSRGQVVLDEKGNLVQMIGTGQDVTEQKKIEYELLSKTKELEATNLELQKFAYVASHDLQEPLRKIIIFTSLLDTQLKDVVSEKGKTYIEKVISSSTRMQRLIDDILYFSKFRNNANQFTEVNLNNVINQVLSDIEIIISQKKAVIAVSQLPAISANLTQMEQLFQNLISNAVKFSKENVIPEVSITSTMFRYADLPPAYVSILNSDYSVTGDPKFWEKETFCKVTICDNGIGFDEQYAEKIFVIFQRLHGKLEYEGTGIGLAICKKIVENHHGIITANSKKSEGANFEIILPLSQKNFNIV